VFLRSKGQKQGYEVKFWTVKKEETENSWPLSRFCQHTAAMPAEIAAERYMASRFNI